jgi:hypothetical protein
MIRRLRGPAFLLLVGALALLALFLILAGVLALAERTALAAEGGYPPVTSPCCAPYPGQPYPGAAANGPQNQAQPGVSIVPADSDYYGKDSEGGQS